MKKKEIVIFLIFSLLAIPVAYLYFITDFNSKVAYIEKDIHGRVENIELIQKLIADMPALLGAFEFQSYGQVDIIIEKIMERNEIIKDFFVLDNNFSVLHLKQSNYENVIESFKSWPKENPYLYFGNNIYLLKKVYAKSGGTSFFIMFRISVEELFKRKLKDAGINGVTFSSYPTVVSSEKLELVELKSNSAQLDAFLIYLMKNILGLTVVIILASLVFIWMLRWLITPFREITFYLQNLSNKNIGQVDLQKYPRIFKPFITNIIEANRAIVTSFEREREIEIQQSLFKVAQQVAHDIRSPLGVLKTVKPELGLLSQNVRRAIQMSVNRIEEITLNLLKTNDSEVVEKDAKSDELLSLVENVLIEKRIEFRNYPAVEIHTEFDAGAFGLFSQVRRSFLKRVISNLINNCVEATSGTCVIEVQLFQEDSMNVLSIKDNGPGIPPDVMPKLFEKGFSTKSTGNGLGLSSAKEEVERIGGHLKLTSEIGKGVSVHIHLPKAATLDSFARSIDLFRYKKVIVLDDDYSIHEVWDTKINDGKMIVEHFYTARELLEKYQSLDETCLLLSDFELVGEDYDGIHVISKLNHAKNSILVTARSEESEIIERCEKKGISFLSKTLMSYIPINRESLQIILIDDEKLCHWRWSEFCKKKGLTFYSYFSIEEFITINEKFKKENIIFLDSDLGKGERGEVDGEKIYKLGFYNLYLSTNYPKGAIAKPKWIKSVLSKDPEEAFQIVSGAFSYTLI